MTYRFQRGQAKFKNVKTVIDGVKFDSKAEARRHEHLKLLVKIGEITNLELQPCYDIVVNGTKVCRYIADFRYVRTSDQTTVVEDVKSPASKTPVYRLKNKLLKALLGINITEIM
jgi:hypothetical protein